MSSGISLSAHFDRIRQVRHITKVPETPSETDSSNPVLKEEFRGAELTLSSNILPAPSFPAHYPVGPEFYPSDSEDGLDATEENPVRRSIPNSVRGFFQRGHRSSKQESVPGSEPTNSKHITSSSTAFISSQPKQTMLADNDNSHKELVATVFEEPVRSVDGRTLHTALTYEERMAIYQQHYGYMKTWAGLLRILGCIELLFGAAVFACVCAYVYKDNEWYNMFGYSQPQMYSGYMSGMGSIGGYGGSGNGGIYYTGPQTPFVLVVAGLAWVVTVVLLVLGMTMHYRTVLLNSSWFPLVEFFINLILAVLYLGAAIVYVRDTLRGGLCNYPAFNMGINGGFCRAEPGQTAAIIFLFVTLLVYLVSAIVCIKVQQQEAARRRREWRDEEMKIAGYPAPRPMNYKDLEAQPPKQTITQLEVLDKHLPSGPFPEPVVLPDYVEKYPSIHTEEERERYKAVFTDQHAEYKELHADVQGMLKRFDELDGLMRNLPANPSSQMEQSRIHDILEEYQRKKMDPSFLEKKERCEYLKSKLSHIKQKIQEYDKVMDWNNGYS